MDPPAMMNDGSYSFAEIWPFQVHGSGGVNESGGGLGLRGVQFGQNLSQFGTNREVYGDDPVSLEHKVANGNGARKRRDIEDESAKVVSTSSGNGNGNGVNDSDGKRIKTSGSRDDNQNSIGEAEPSSGKPVEKNSKQPEPPKQDYIHVRARRGQATDSHSLAERARREKISERMKILQDLVPGCSKVIGKALVLDEIINYIQSLQQQVEFLSMKLEAVNSRVNPGIEVFPLKDFGQQTFDTAGFPFGSQAPRDFDRVTSPEWLHMQMPYAQVVTNAVLETLKASKLVSIGDDRNHKYTSRRALAMESEANSKFPSTAKDICIPTKKISKKKKKRKKRKKQAATFSI